MKLLYTLHQLPAELRGGALAIGNFDGVHRGHAHLLSRLKSLAQTIEGPAIVLTFDPHPVRVLNPAKAPTPLTWTDRKAELIGACGIDVVIAYPTDRELLALSYDEFFREIVEQKIGAHAMVEGPNFFFGRDRQGDVVKLDELCRSATVRLEIVEPIQIDGEYISSSRIRGLIGAGQVGLARTMLTQPYRLRGLVTRGDRRGRELGFPTANLSAVETLVPRAGVYAGRTQLENSKYWSAIHIGPSPTFSETSKIEVHLLDFEGSIYGKSIEVEFFEPLRGARKFTSADELRRQLKQDIQQTRQIAKQHSAQAG